ncbi:unnamed protein product [Protopolystoma xenopodis]|uniref:Tubulin epsilon and delta complex protein 1 domain-containing protein n=1 Tax=Protopolystoma xenopodis TaxID=117903 RepID=A0A3S5BFT9_9PLAT|nr:unnamed protein product [Protopolystoma xenopodis]
MEKMELCLFASARAALAPVLSSVSQSETECIKEESLKSLEELIWLKGRLSTKLKQMYHLRLELVRLTHNLWSKGSLDENNVLNPVFSWIFGDKIEIKMCSRKLEQANFAIGALIAWREAGEEFWRWMNSVLDIKLKEGPYEYSDILRHHPYEMDLEKLLSIYKDLLHTVSQYSFIADRFETNWETSNSVDDKDSLKKLLVCIDDDILFFQHHLTPSISDDMDFNELGLNSHFIWNSQDKSDHDDPCEPLCSDISLDKHKLDKLTELVKAELKSQRMIAIDKLQKFSSSLSPNVIYLFDPVK